MPAVALCVLAGYAVMGFTTLEPGPQRERWRRAAIGALVVGVAFLVVKAGSFGALRSELRFIERTHGELTALLAEPRVRAGLRCGPLTFPTYRLVPDARWSLDAGAAESARAPAPTARSARRAPWRSTSPATRSSSGASGAPTGCRAPRTVRRLARRRRARPVACL